MRPGASESPSRRVLPRLASWQTRRQRWIVIVAIAVLAPLATALAGLVVADVLPNPSHRGAFWGHGSTTWIRLLSFVISLLLLVLSVRWRDYLGSRRGTLYYVRVLDAYMHDWHRAAQGVAAREVLSYRLVSRWVTMSQVTGVVDVREAVAGTVQDLQRHLSDDDARTGYHVAPNMLWPLALGVGYDLIAPEETTLRDFGNPQGNQPVDAFEWCIADLRKAPPAHFKEVVTRIEAGRCPAGAVLVQANLTGRGQVAEVPFPLVSRVNVGVFAKGSQVSVSVGIRPGEGQVHPAAAAEQWVTAIRKALHDHAGQVVVLVAAVPKTVALAAGYLLANPDSPLKQSKDPGCGYENCRNEGCRRPWNFLLPLHYDLQHKEYFPVWVRPEQTDPRIYLAGLGTRERI